MDYYGTYLYYNEQHFVADQYGEKSVSGVSSISELQIRPRNPIWFDFDYESY